MKATITILVALALVATQAWAGPPQQAVINQLDTMTPCGHQRHVAEAAVNERIATTTEIHALAITAAAGGTATDFAIVRQAYALAPATLTNPDAAKNFSMSILYGCIKEAQ